MRLRPYETDGFRLHEANPWVHIVFMVMAVIFWGVIIYGLVLFINKYAKNPTPAGHDEALSIAKARYAKGEISKAEYDKLKKDLS